VLRKYLLGKEVAAVRSKASGDEFYRPNNNIAALLVNYYVYTHHVKFIAFVAHCRVNLSKANC